MQLQKNIVGIKYLETCCMNEVSNCDEQYCVDGLAF